jgi:hypothetical protein
LSESLATTQEAKMVKLYIVWGTSPNMVNHVPCEYEFNAQEQADAFLLGVSEAQGWDSSSSFISVEDAERHIAKANGYRSIRKKGEL